MDYLYICSLTKSLTMKSFVAALSTLLMVISCSSEPNVVHLRTEKGKKETSSPVHANRMLTMEIEGMTCEMGCGGSIRKELKGTGGVARVEFDFKEGKEIQTAKISFDSNKISEEEMVKIVDSMNEDQFAVGKTNSIDLENTNSNAVPSNKSEKPNVELSETSFALPNLFDILANLF